MNKQKRLILFSLALIAMLLLAAVPATARTEPTPFVAIVYPCGQEDPGHIWTSKDGVTHVRGSVDYALVESEDPRMTGSGVWRGNQDMNPDGTGPAWGTMVIHTAMGTWRIVWKATYDGGVPASYGQGHGSHGLQGQAMYYTGRLLFDALPNPCNTPIAVTFTGYILNHKGN